MATSIVYLIYLWVTIIHCIFVGATLYFFFGKRFIKNKLWFNALCISICLAFLETYWIPLLSPLQLNLVTENNDILQHFEINSNTNIAAILRPSWFNIILWILQGCITEWISRKQFIRITQSKK